MVWGLVAQINMRLGFPFPLSDLSYGLCLWYTKHCEAPLTHVSIRFRAMAENRGSDLDLRDLPIERAPAEFFGPKAARAKRVPGSSG